MKKLVLALSTFALVFAFSACGGPKADGKKLAEKKCECRKFRKAGDKENYEKCREELAKLDEELDQKYADKEDDKEVIKEFFEGMNSVKCED